MSVSPCWSSEQDTFVDWFPQSTHLHESVHGSPCLTQEHILLSGEQPDLYPQHIEERMASGAGGCVIQIINIWSPSTFHP